MSPRESTFTDVPIISPNWKQCQFSCNRQIDKPVEAHPYSRTPRSKKKELLLIYAPTQSTLTNIMLNNRPDSKDYLLYDSRKSKSPVIETDRRSSESRLRRKTINYKRMQETFSGDGKILYRFVLLVTRLLSEPSLPDLSAADVLGRTCCCCRGGSSVHWWVLSRSPACLTRC